MKRMLPDREGGPFRKEELMARDPGETAWRMAEDAKRAAQTAADAGKDAVREGAEAARRTATQSGALIADGMQLISREMMDLTRRSIEQSLRRFGMLAHCRTPQDLLAAQSEIVRETLEDFAASARRIAEISNRMAGGAAKTLGAIPKAASGEVVAFRRR